jgi:two-component system, OmpR family, phosphate regulon sensor histidine kinase PhoR
VKNKQVLFLTIFGSIIIMAMMVVQIFWIKGALNISAKQFEENVTVALRQVAERMAYDNKSMLKNYNPVKKINDNYYIVQLNGAIDATALDHYLSTAFNYYNLSQDVEYSIYDCSSNDLVYCNYIQYKKNSDVGATTSAQPKFSGLDYYFTVSFPHLSIMSMHNVPMWVITSILLALAMLFFIYALYVVFKQHSISILQKDFINNMTHEFKTPISTIGVIQQVIADPKITEDPQRLSTYANIIGEEISRLDQQVERVLHIAKFEKGQSSLNKEELDLCNIVDTQVKSIQAKNTTLDITFTIEGEARLIKADRLHFTNILHNLIDNAIKYGGKPLVINIALQFDSKNTTLAVSDNGIGISPKDQKKVFDKFYRVPTGDIHNVKGFGLGLYYVASVVDRHNWKIRVHSALQKGTKIIITIPNQIPTWQKYFM